jgi:hypothetical protein
MALARVLTTVRTFRNALMRSAYCLSRRYRAHWQYAPCTTPASAPPAARLNCVHSVGVVAAAMPGVRKPHPYVATDTTVPPRSPTVDAPPAACTRQTTCVPRQMQACARGITTCSARMQTCATRGKPCPQECKLFPERPKRVLQKCKPFPQLCKPLPEARKPFPQRTKPCPRDANRFRSNANCCCRFANRFPSGANLHCRNANRVRTGANRCWSANTRCCNADNLRSPRNSRCDPIARRSRGPSALPPRHPGSNRTRTRLSAP